MHRSPLTHLALLISGASNHVVLEGHHEHNTAILGLGDDHAVLGGAIEVGQGDVGARRAEHRVLLAAKHQRSREQDVSEHIR